MEEQQGDVLLYQTPDDGDITVTGGIVQMTQGFETAVYLSIFGGNEDGSNWWGNVVESEPDKRYVSETQKLLLRLPVTSANLLRIEDAMKRDLSWVPSNDIKISASILGLNQVQLEIHINDIEYTYTIPWGNE